MHLKMPLLMIDAHASARLAIAESSIRVADCRDRLMQYAHAYVKMQREGRGAGLGPSPGGHAAQASGLVAGEKGTKSRHLGLLQVGEVIF